MKHAAAASYSMAVMFALLALPVQANPLERSDDKPAVSDRAAIARLRKEIPAGLPARAGPRIRA